MGGEDGRGGLLVVDPDADDNESNTLRMLIGSSYYDGDFNDPDDPDDPDDPLLEYRGDEEYLHVMKELRDEKLLTKKYIKDHHLLFHTCNPAFTQQRFDFYCDCCPEGLKDHQHDNLPLIHAITKSKKDSVATFLMAAAKHHMIEACLLFQYDNNGVTACEKLFEKFGKEAAMRLIGDCIPFHEPQRFQSCTMLNVAKHPPQLLNDFSAKYLSSAHLRDDNGRNLDQTLLASGKTTFKNNGLFFIRTLIDDQVREIDPVTDLYPFMVAASGDISDLSAVYVLLGRNQSLVRNGIKHNNRRRKRRASTSNGTKRMNI